MPANKQSDLPLYNGKPAPKELVDGLVAMIIVCWSVTAVIGLIIYII